MSRFATAKNASETIIITESEPEVEMDIDIPDDYLVKLWEKVERSKTSEELNAAKETLRLELFNVISILNFCEENDIPYIMDRIKIFKQIDALTRYPQDPFVEGDVEMLQAIGYSIKDPCKRVFQHDRKVLARSYTAVCFHPFYGKYTHHINKLAYFPMTTKKKPDYKHPELDLRL